MTWRVVLQQDNETLDWAVWCPELPGCVSAGDSQEEAVENMKEAIALYLEPAPLQLDPDAVVRKIAI
jgi:predicted RNase H-like HicB family nuclease